MPLTSAHCSTVICFIDSERCPSDKTETSRAQELFLTSHASFKLDLVVILIKCFFNQKMLIHHSQNILGNELICNFFHCGDGLAFKKDSILDLRNLK